MSTIDPEYTNLLNDLSENREKLNGMLETAEEFRKKINNLIPDNADFRKKYLIEEKMKLIISAFGIELDIRKQKEASIKTEIELKRKLAGEETSTEETYRTAEWLAKQIEKLEGKKIPVFEEEKPSIVQLPINKASS